MKYLITLLLLLVAIPVGAKEFKGVAQPREVNKPEISQPNEELEIATSSNVYLNDSNNIVISQIRQGESIGKITLDLYSKVNTLIKIRYDDENIVVKNKREELKLGAGVGFKLQFAAFQPTQGYIEILNANDEVIFTVPYKVLDAKSVSQTIRTSVSHSLRANSEDTTRLSLGYRASFIPDEQTDGKHGLGVRVTSDIDFEDVRFTIDYNYSF